MRFNKIDMLRKDNWLQLPLGRLPAHTCRDQANLLSGCRYEGQENEFYFFGTFLC